MRVAFNALPLQEPHTGTGRYVYNLLAALGRVDGVNEYHVISPGPMLDAPETPSSFKWQVVPGRYARLAGKKAEKVAWEQHSFPLAARREDARVMHVPYFAPPLRPLGIPVVVTIHDVINLRRPEYHANAGSQGYARLVALAARSAAIIIAVSEDSKRDIIEALDVPEGRVRVIREAPPANFHRVADIERLEAVRETYGLGERFVLNVGGLDARKNLATLIGAFAAVYHEMGGRDLQLFIAGDPDRLGTSPLFPDWRSLIPMFGIAGQVICMPVAEDDLPALYSAASCFVCTSRYEGFGLTPLEAMACGTPVVCSNASALPEVVGSAGVLVNPDDPDQIGAEVHRILASHERRDDLSARGLAHVKQFSWERTAAETSALYAEVTGTGRD